MDRSMPIINLEESRSLEPHPVKHDPVPGVTLIPDPVSDGDNEDLMSKIQTEFIMFVKTVTQIIKVLKVIKSRHLKSLTPIPSEVLREIQVTCNHGDRYKKFDKQTVGNVPGLSESAKHFFSHIILSPRSDTTPGQISLKKAPTSTLKRGHTKKHDDHQQKIIAMLNSQIVSITGKRTIPIWQQVAMEKPPDDLTRLKLEQEQAKQKEGKYVDQQTLWKMIHGKDTPLTRTWSQSIVESIRVLKASKLEASQPALQSQMDMALARAEGFPSVGAYDTHLENIKPQWFKDLVSSATKVGIVRSEEVVLALEALGKYYHIEPNRILLVKAKLCFMVSSYPLYDICQVHTQKAFNFVLQEIVKIDPSQNLLKAWLWDRKLPYLVTRPIYSVDSL